MAELKQFKLPDVGEGLTEADILRWDVKVGDLVLVNQTLVEVETAKAAVELPSPFAGEVVRLHYDEGVTVAVGEPIITIKVGADDAADESGGGIPGSVSAPPPDAPHTAVTAPSADLRRSAATIAAASGDLIPVLPGDGDIGEPSQLASQPERATGQPTTPQREAVLVGYGVPGERGRRRKRTVSAPTPAPNANPAFDVTPGTAAATPLADDRVVLAKPPVRKLAKNLGVDLAAVPATGPNGTISRSDVEAAAQLGRTSYAAASSLRGEETRIPIKGIRKLTATAMVSSAFTAPHVTEFITVDVTEMMGLRDRVAARPEFRRVKVSPLLFVARAVLWAARRTPIINSTWDEAAGEIVVKHYVNLGIAAATERGLIVPNIKGADGLTLLELAEAMSALTETARSGKTQPADMTGGTLTITNVGIFGVDTGTPILNPGEAAILALGAVRRQPWVVVGNQSEERIEPRWITQLAVSFDHRSVDGQQGSTFLADVAAVLRDPGLAML